MINLILAASSLLPAHLSTDISDVLPKGFKDASFVATVQQGNQKELAKINDDFAKSYRFKTTNVKMREPFMMRLEANVDDMSILFIVNGTNKLIRIPKANLNQRQNVAKSPGKRQTILDFGMVAPSLFGSLFEAKFVRVDRATKDVVFDLTYLPSLKDGTRHRVWIDPVKKFTTKREWYSQIDSRLVATFTYSDAEQVGGVWFPTKMTVRNADNKVAGVTTYEGLKANTGLADSLFKVN